MKQTPFQGISGIGSVGSSPSTSSIGSIGKVSSPLAPSNVSEADGESFSGMLSNYIGQVNEATTTIGDKTTALLNGRLENIHEMTIAGKKSGVMMKLTTTVTGKLAQAVTQLFQMQI